MGSRRPLVGSRRSWVDGHSWVAEIIVHGWGMVVIGGGVVIRRRGVLQSWAFIVQKAAVNVERPDGRATSAVWWWRRLLVPSPLPSPLLMSVVVVSIIVVSGSVSRCVVVVVSDGGGDS